MDIYVASEIEQNIPCVIKKLPVRVASEEKLDVELGVMTNNNDDYIFFLVVNNKA